MPDHSRSFCLPRVSRKTLSPAAAIPCELREIAVGQNRSIECLAPGWFRLPATLGASIVVCAGSRGCTTPRSATAGRKGAASGRTNLPSFARDERVEALTPVMGILPVELDRSSVGVPVIFAGESA